MQFGRKWQVTLYSENKALRIDNLRVVFDVKKEISSKPNPAQIKIYNLSQSNIEKVLTKEFKNITLAVGYRELNLIFAGDIIKVSVIRDGVDTILSLTCSDGFNAYTKGRINLSLDKGATDDAIFKELSKAMKIPLDQFEIINKRELPRGRVLNGDIRTILDKLAINNNADWSIQNGRLIFVPKDKVLINQAVVLSQDTGMIKSPQRTDDGLNISCLLNPRLAIGGLISVKSMINSFNGFYKIISITHKGDGLSSQWQSDIVAVEGNFKSLNGGNNG